MTKLEEEIHKMIDANTSGAWFDDEKTMIVGLTASLVRRYIGRALSDAFNQAHYSNLHPDVVKRMEYNEWANQWLKENGLSE